MQTKDLSLCGTNVIRHGGSHRVGMGSSTQFDRNLFVRVSPARNHFRISQARKNCTYQIPYIEHVEYTDRLLWYVSSGFTLVKKLKINGHVQR